jgi:hypothetical protein
MIDRYTKFTDEELHELRYGLLLAQRARRFALRDHGEEAAIRTRLEAEIDHVRTQRLHRAHREALPA